MNKNNPNNIEENLEIFFIEISELSAKYDHTKYKELIENFINKLYKPEFYNSLEEINTKFENTKIKNNNKKFLNNSDFLYNRVPLFSKQNFLINQILIIITNFEMIFLNELNYSLEISFKFILYLIENQFIEGPFLILSYLNKLIAITNEPCFIKEEYLEKLNQILNSIQSEEENIKILIDQMKSLLHKNKNLIEDFDDIEKKLERESHISILDNKSFISESFKQDFFHINDYKNKVNNNLKNENILQIFSQLKKEEEEIQNEMDNRNLSSYFTSRLSNLNKKHLYIFYKIINIIDNNEDANLKRIFYNLIFRSKSFSQFLLKSVKISHNFLDFKDKDVYIHQYATIGHFFSNKILNTDLKMENKIQNFVKMIEKVINNIKTLISKELEKKKNLNEFKYLEYNFDESKMNNEINSFMCNSTFSLEYNHVLLNLNIFNINTKILQITLNDILKVLQKVSQIENKIKLINSNFYFNINTKLFPNMRVIMTVNSPEVFRLNCLFPFVKYDSVIMNLYLYLKYWATQRKLIYTFDDAFNESQNSNQDNFIFDSSTLLIIIIFYLINIGYLPKFEKNFLYSDKFLYFLKQKGFREILNNEDNSSEFNFKEIFYFSHTYDINILCKLNDEKLRKTEVLGKIFINFFNFILNIINNFKSHHDYSLVIDLNFKSPNIIRHNNNGKILIVDNLFKFEKDKLCGKNEMKSHCDYLNEINKEKIQNENNLFLNRIKYNQMFKEMNEDYDILEKWKDRQINTLEQESLRVLHYAINQEQEEFIKIFLKYNS